MKLLKRFLYFVTLPVLLIALWWFTTRNGASFFVPKPGPLVHAFHTI